MRCKRVIPAALLVGIAAALTGCAGVEVPALSPAIPAHWNHVAEGDATPVDLHGWWRVFHDPQLDALVDAALSDNLDVAAAHERLLAARDLERSANAPFLPSVTAKTEDVVDPDASASFLVAGFDALWELPLFGRGAANRRQAEGNRDVALADLQQVRVSLVAEVVRDWLQLHAAQDTHVACGRMVVDRQKQLALWQTRQRLRLASPAEVATAEASLDQARDEQAASAQSIESNAYSLAALLGRLKPDPAWFDTGVLANLGALTLTSAPADLLRTRPEIARAQAEVLSAAGDAGVAYANRFPSVGIGGSIVWSTNIATHRRTNDNGIWSVGPVLDIPLLDWGLRQAQSQSRNHQLKAAVYAYRQAVLNGVAEVETALGELDQQRVREQQSMLAVAAEQRAQTVADKRVQLGLESQVGQLDSSLATEQATLTSIDARLAHGIAFVRLYKALGGAPLPADASAHTLARVGS